MILCREVEDKLQKKKLLDEVRTEIKMKEMQIKNMKIDKKLTQLEKQKLYQKRVKEFELK